jgi:GNAT superfamily N-acetyltransferase
LSVKSTKIRPYKSGDASGVIEIMREIFIDEYGWSPLFLREAIITLRKMLMTMIPSVELFLVCESEEGLSGVMFLKRADKDTVFVRWLVVKKEFRKRGIGWEMLDMGLEFSRGVGYRKVKLNTVGELHGAMEFYRSAGFLEIGREEKHLWKMEMTIHYLEMDL